MHRWAKAALLLFVVTLCLGAAYVSFRPKSVASAPAPRELYSVVNEQLAAFRAEDFPSAYRYAGSAVHQKFTLSEFETMIRRNYAHMAHAQRVEFGLVDVRGSSAVMQVYFFDGRGAVRSFLYSLMAERGVWKIDGAEEVEVIQHAAGLIGSHA